MSKKAEIKIVEKIEVPKQDFEIILRQAKLWQLEQAIGQARNQHQAILAELVEMERSVKEKEVVNGQVEKGAKD